MLKRKSKNKDRKVSKSQLIIVGSLLIVVGIGIVGGKYLYNYFQNQNEENLIDTFYEEQKEITDETTPTEEKKQEEQQKPTTTTTQSDRKSLQLNSCQLVGSILPFTVCLHGNLHEQK